MSITVSTELDTVLDGTVHQVQLQVSLDLDITGADFSTVFTEPIASISLTQQNGTDLPDEVRDVVGFTALGGQLVLSGPIAPLSKHTMAWLLNPDNAASPFYRQSIKGVPVTVDLGYRVPGSAASEWVRKFTGTVAALSSLDHDAGTVTLDLVDRSIDYDALPDIPGVIVADPYNAGLTSAYCMDAIIRTSGRDSTWPATRPHAVLAVGLVSSLWPEVGVLATGASQPSPVFEPGAYGPALAGTNGAATGFGETVYSLAASPTGGSIFLEAFVTGIHTGSAQVSYDFGVRAAGVINGVVLNANSSGLHWLIQSGERGTITAAPDDGLHYIAAHLTYDTASPPNVTGTIWLDGTSQAVSLSSTDSVSAATLAHVNYAGVAAYDGATIAGVQITAETAPMLDWPFTPAAVLDVSLNPLTVVPEIAASTKGSDELQTIAAAELGYARFDEQGVFRFTNRNTIAQAGITRDVTADTALKPGLTTSIGADTEYDHIQVPFTAWTPAAPTALFTLVDVRKIPRSRTTSWTQPLDSGTLGVNIDTAVSLLPNGHNPTDGGSWYRASVDAYGTTAHPGLTITATPVSSGTVLISAVNATRLDAYLTTPASYTDLTAGSASSGLWIGGTPVKPSDEALTDSVYGDGAKPALVVASNAYVQDQDTAQAVGDYLLPQLTTAVRDFTGVAIIPDPRIQITDKIHVVEPYRALVDEYAYVWGSAFTAEFGAPGESGGTWDMTLDVRALGPPGAWLLAVPGRSELGNTATGSAWLYTGGS